MSRTIQSFLAAVCCAIVFSACHSVPDHAKYIPGDAVVVIGVNTNELQKKIAWSAITGSRLIDELQAASKDSATAQGMKDLEHAGISYGSTLYFYMKSDNRYRNEMKAAAVLPLKDAKEWEAFLKKILPAIQIKDGKDRKEALLNNMAYAGWNSDVLIVMTPINTKHEVSEPFYGDTMYTHMVDTFRHTDWSGVDEVATAAEMQANFSLTKDNSVVKNDRFTDLEKQGNDMTFFLNYSSLMDKYSQGGMGMMGAAMGKTLWANAAVTAGVNFKDGMIESDVAYYPSDSLRAVSKAFGNENVDKDMVERMPGQNLAMAVTYHLNPDGIKMMLDKMGMTGLANMALMQEGLSIDDILGSFTGDMAFTMNSFHFVKKTMEVDSAMLQYMNPDDFTHWEPEVDYLFAMKLKSKSSFDKLMAFVMKNGDFVNNGNNTYTLNSGSGQTVTIVFNDNYAAVSNNAANATAFIQGKNSQKVADEVRKVIEGHPMGLYADVKGMMSNVPGDVNAGHTQDSMAVSEFQKLLTTVTISGGEFKNNATRMHITINFADKSENALLQMLHFIQQMAAIKQSAIKQSAPIADNPVTAPAVAAGH